MHRYNSMSNTMGNTTNSISYSNTVYSTNTNLGPGIDIKDLSIVEDWDGRPASDWSIQRIGVLQSKIEQFTYRIYHSNRYGKHNLSKVIPGYVLIQYANEAFGYDGWRMEIIDVEATQCLKIPMSTSDLQKLGGENLDGDTNKDEDSKFNYMVMAEAQVKITLKDGTNTQRGGVGKCTLPSKGNCYSKVKKEAVGDALKQALLSFEQIINDYNEKIDNNYFVDGLYVAKVKTESQHNNRI